MSEFDDAVIAEFRAGGGRVDFTGFGSGLVLLHTRGARTGRARVNPATSLRDGEDWLVVASAKDATKEAAAGLVFTHAVDDRSAAAQTQSPSRSNPHPTRRGRGHPLLRGGDLCPVWSPP